MLRHDTDVPEILRTGAVGYQAEEENADERPERVGSYRILEKLGEGGMGVVYLAEQQQPVQRTVALKLIKRGLETRQVLGRFDTERQALALMNHPNIAQVHDAGVTEDGRPYFAMEYVEGDPLTEHCDKVAGGIRERLELLMRVCDGVQHAHQKGVIHRDIKASNVLVAIVDGRAVPKIIDFGIAKATEQSDSDGSRITQQGQLFGTPASMSPEQAGANVHDIDTRTDVYALGVLLYELLVGTPPTPLDADVDEIRRRIREDEPTRPAALIRRLRGDLDWITMKALAKERERRYSSPSELAADIERHLRDEPVLAGPPSKLYRARKFARKHRAGVGFTAAIFILLAGFAAAIAHEARRADRAAILAKGEARRAREEARHAQGVSAFLIQLFEAAAPSDAGAECATVCDVIDGAIGDLTTLSDEPFLQARLMLVLGKLIHDQGATATGREALGRALANLDDNPATMEFLEVAGFTTAILRRLDEAELTFTHLVETQRRSRGERDPATLHMMAELGRVYTMQGRLERADAQISTTLEGMRSALGHADPYTLTTTGYLSMVYWRQGRLEDAGKLLAPALEDMRGVLGEGHYITLATLYNLARVEANRGHRREALDLLRLAVDGGFIYMGRDEQGRLVLGHPGMLTDPHLAALHGDPEFEAIVKGAL